MPRPLRIDYPGALHHIFFRGNRKEDIFIDPSDRLQFLRFLSNAKERYGVKIYAYCLMNNHAHFLTESGSIHIGRFMQELLTNYVQYFNRRWNRVGHLMQDRYKSILVDKESYLLTLVKYIHRNPVKDNLCKTPEEYQWSSHLEYIGKRKPIVDKEVILSYFDNIKDYKNFIDEREVETPEIKRYKRYSFYGDEKFISNALEKISQQKRAVGGEREEITFKDVEEFIRTKFSKRLNDLTPHKDMEIKRYVVVILKDRLHYTLRRISEIIEVKTWSVPYIYRTSNKDWILNEFDGIHNSQD